MKYVIKKCGFGKSYYLKIVSVSNIQGKKLKREGNKVFDSKSEAQEYINGKK